MPKLYFDIIDCELNKPVTNTQFFLEPESFDTEEQFKKLYRDLPRRVQELIKPYKVRFDGDIGLRRCREVIKSDARAFIYLRSEAAPQRPTHQRYDREARGLAWGFVGALSLAAFIAVAYKNQILDDQLTYRQEKTTLCGRYN